MDDCERGIPFQAALTVGLNAQCVQFSVLCVEPREGNGCGWFSIIVESVQRSSSKVTPPLHYPAVVFLTFRQSRTACYRSVNHSASSVSKTTRQLDMQARRPVRLSGEGVISGERPSCLALLTGQVSQEGVQQDRVGWFWNSGWLNPMAMAPQVVQSSTNVLTSKSLSLNRGYDRHSDVVPEVVAAGRPAGGRERRVGRRGDPGQRS